MHLHRAVNRFDVDRYKLPTQLPTQQFQDLGLFDLGPELICAQIYELVKSPKLLRSLEIAP